MGSFENSSVIAEPLRELAIEEHSSPELSVRAVPEQQCSDEVAENLENSTVNPTLVLDGCPGLSGNEKSGCVSSGDCIELGVEEPLRCSIIEQDPCLELSVQSVSERSQRLSEDNDNSGRVKYDYCAETPVEEPSFCGLVIEQHSCMDFWVQSVSEQECCSEVACNLDISNVDCTDVPGKCQGLSQNDNTGASSGDVIEMAVIAGDRRVSECENVVVLASGKGLNNEHGVSGICHSETRSEIDVHESESDELCLGKGMTGSVDGSGNLLEGCKTHSPVASSLENFAPQDGHMDDKSIIEPCAVEVMDIVEKKNNNLGGIETNNGDQISLSQGCKVHSEVRPLSGLLSDGSHENEQGSKSLNGPSGDRVMEVMNGIADASSAIAADMRNQISTSQGGVLASPLLHMGDSAINYDLENHQKDDNNSDQQNDQEDDNKTNGLSAEGFTKVLEMKSDVEACIQVLPSHGCQKTSQWIDDSLNNSGQTNDKREDKSVDSPSAANVIEAGEVKSDSTADIKVEICTQTLPIEENACNLKKSSFEMAANCFSEKSVSQLSCEPFGAVDDRSSKRLDVPDLYGKDGIGDTNSSSTSDCTRQTNSVVKDDIKFDRVLKTKCPGIGSPSSQKSSEIGKSKRKTKTKRSESKCRNTVKVAYPRGSIELTFKVARRNRSCFSKPARSSIWGLLGNITQYFDQNNDLGVNQIQNQRSLKVRGSKGRGKQKKNQAGRNSRGSRGNSNASTTHVRLKVKVGKELGESSPNINISDVINTSVLANAIDGDHRTSSWGTTSELPKLPTAIEYKLENEGIGRQLQCFKENTEKTHSDASILDVHLENKDQEGTVILEKPAGDTADDSCGIPSQIVVETLTGTTENRYIDPGTSPDSEVINLNPDAQVGAGHIGDLHEAVLISSIDLTAARDVTRSKRGKKKDKLSCGGNCILEDRLPGPVSMNKTKLSKKCRCRQKTGGGLYSSETLTSSNTANALSISSSDKELSTEPLSLLRGTEIGVSREDSKVGSGKEATTCCSQDVGPRLSESNNSMNLLPSAKVKGHKLPKSSKSGGKSKGRSKISDSVKSRGQNSCRRRENQKKLVIKGEVKEKGVSDQVVCKMESHSEKGNNIIEDFGNINTGDNVASFDVSNLDMVPGVVDQNSPLHKAWVSCDDCHKWRRIPPTLADSIGITNCKWTCKDNEDKAFADCTIPQEMTNAEINAELEISDDTCEEDAPDSRLNYMKLECRPSKVNQTSEFTQILTNQFLHRSPKTQTIDEIMVCHCKSPLDGRLGCRDECLNRMLNIECVQGTCPCGDLCSNQQFQKKQYAKLEWFRCGKKGYGLQVLENVSKGHFLIEYVGEVLDMHSYQARQKEYASMGHKHFYFMTLNGNEVIDACDKGNLGRFINHSCDPNCRTEKWVVNGEICIGLFALRSIKKGEELTFDYNYVRVFGAAAKKCFCGSPQCRGYIGGDPLNTEVIVQCDSDEEYPEPVMLLEDDETGDSLANTTSRTSSVFDAEMPAQSMLEDKRKMNESVTAVGLFEITSEIEDSMNRTSSALSQVRSSVEVEDSTGKLTSSVQPVAEDVTSKPVSTVQQEISMEEATVNNALCATQRLETSSPTVTLSKSLPDGLDANRKSNADTVDDKRVSSKLRALMKTSRSSNSSKKRIVISKALKANKPQVMINIPQVLSTKSKKIMESSANGRFEVVQEKLNELLDADGGISKRKDAPKGYLKLLLLTVASGDRSNGEAIQSNRDLSMILDALMKTKSRMVLIDIINKNGLRMLHNIMKQYRRDFKKIPILRKLLKVLEYLAVREILTLEHINGGPPCPGMESFRESMLSLTEHEDKQVHQIARSFRDRWIPRPVRKHSYMDRDNDRMEFHRNPNYNRFPAPHNPWHDQATRPPEAIDCVKQTVIGTIPGNTDVQEGCSASCIGVSPTNGTKPRKRKSRWDQPAEIKPDSRSVQLMEKEKDSRLLQESESSQLRNTGDAVLDHIDIVSREDRNCHGDLQNLCQQDEAIRFNDEGLNIQEDVPPGFSFPHKPPMVLSNALSSANDIYHQNVCYSKHPLETVIGHPRERFTSRLPVSYGIPLSIVQQFGTPQAENVESWVIAPGMPFHPFPPLPPYSRKDTAPPCAVNPMTTNQPAAEGQQESHGGSSFYSDGSVPSTTGSNQQDVDIPDANNQHMHKRMRDSSYEMGRRYFKQQKWNLGPPWLRKRNGWGFMGNSSKGGTCNIGIGSMENDLKNSYCPEDDVSCRVEKGGNNFYQHPQHQNQH